MYKYCHSNIIMSTSLVFILNIIFVSYVQSDIPQIMCGYAGPHGKFGYRIKVSEIPSRCTDIYYGSYYFNETLGAEEITDLASIKKANKPIWLFMWCQDPQELATIVCSKDSSALENYVGPAVKYLKDNKVDGIVLSELGLHDGKIPKYANVVAALINKLRQCLPSIKLGLCVYTDVMDKFSDKNIFDFTVTNDIVDFYLFETSANSADCAADSNAKGGKLPASIMDGILKAISGSAMDKSKFMSIALDFATSSDEFLARYSDYCTRKGSELWCGDSLKNVYDQGAYLKKHFKGIAIVYLDADDPDQSCKCGLFPVANAIMDGWEGKETPTCASIC